MKKIIIAAVMGVMMIGSAKAIDVDMYGTYANEESRYGMGVALSQEFGPVRGIASYDRRTEGVTQNRYSLGAGMDVVDVGPVTLSGIGSVNYLQNSGVDNGWAYTLGAGAELPITDQTSIVGTIGYQTAIESRVSDFDGVLSTVGFRFGF